MKPKFQDLLRSCPNPSVYIEEPDIPRSVTRPSHGNVFISDFQIPGWEARMANGGRNQKKGGMHTEHLLPKKKKKRQHVEPTFINTLTALQLMEHLPILKKNVQNIATTIDSEHYAIFVMDEQTNELCCTSGDPNTESDDAEFRIPKDSDGLVGYVMSNGGILNIRDAYRYKFFSPSMDKKLGIKSKAILALPIFGKDGLAIGAVEFINKNELQAHVIDNDGDGDIDLDDKTSFFTIHDVGCIRTMLGDALGHINPLPTSAASSSFCPKQLKKEYQDLFTPGIDQLLDTSRDHHQH